jgi:hypothetical protein
MSTLKKLQYIGKRLYLGILESDIELALLEIYLPDVATLVRCVELI